MNGACAAMAWTDCALTRSAAAACSHGVVFFEFTYCLGSNWQQELVGNFLIK